jgi:hypothetical protein
MEWRAMHTPITAYKEEIMKKTMVFCTVLLVLVAFVAVPMIADATETQCAPQCPQCPPAQVEVVNKPVVKAKQRGKWNVTVNNDESNPVHVSVQPDGITVNVTTGYRFVGFTSGSYTGDLGGLVGAANKCRDQYGDDARMCTTMDILNSPPAEVCTEPPCMCGWIQPVPATSLVPPIEQVESGCFIYGYVIDQSAERCGAYEKRHGLGNILTIWNCCGWTDPTPELGPGMAYCNWQMEGQHSTFYRFNCNVTLPIACCAP